MRVMISQPIDGTAEAERNKLRAVIVALLDEQGHEVWGEETRRENISKGVNQDLWQLGRRLQAMAGADAVYFMDGWEKDRRCRLEYEACALFGIRPQNACSSQLVSFTKFLLDKGQFDIACTLKHSLFRIFKKNVRLMAAKGGCHGTTVQGYSDY